MSYNGSGVYTLPGAALANGDIVSATENNTFRNDVAAALNVAWTRDGQAPATANIPMGSHKLTGLAAGTGVGDSVRFEQLPSATNKLDLTTSVTGALPVANGGSGAATLTGVLKGNGTSAFTAAVAGTDYLAPAAIGTTVQGYAAELQGATQGGINGMKNRIINGAMMIDQRNAGAAVSIATTTPTYVLDRWQFAGKATTGTYSVQRSSTAPSGFINSALVTITAADTGATAGDLYRIQYQIEGFNVADLGWGTASAQSVTISFWVRSSVTGTFAGGVLNGNADRSYVFTYSVNSANTWEQKSVTIAGDTSGTWATDNTSGLIIRFSLGTGSTYATTAGAWTAGNYWTTTGSVKLIATNGATFYITGVQLEKGSTATSFDYRPYGTELALCQRYYQSYVGASPSLTWTGDATTGNTYYLTLTTAPLRTAATITLSNVSVSGFSTPLSAVTQNTTANNFVVTGTCNSTGARRYFQFDATLSAEL